MWEQFLADPECRAKSGTAPTILYFPRWRRNDWTVDQKAEKLKRWSDSMAAPDWNLRFLQQVIDGLEADRLEEARRRRISLYSLRLAYWKLRRVCGLDK
jgi:hypothetical protein